jgi:hypothetical protein
VDWNPVAGQGMFEFHKSRGICWLAGQLLASQEGLYSLEHTVELYYHNGMDTFVAITGTWSKWLIITAINSGDY